MSKRQEPKKAVVSVEKVGRYPNVWWEHRLSCGHLERRKRKAPASRVACGQCGAARSGFEPDDDATLLSYEGQVRAAVAERYGVDLEMVLVSAYMDGGFPKVNILRIVLMKDILSEIT